MFVCPDCKKKLDDLKCSSCGRQFSRRDGFPVPTTATSLSFGNYCLWYGMFLAFTFHLVVSHLILGSSFRRYVLGVFTGGTVLAALCFQVEEVLASGKLRASGQKQVF